MMRKPEVPNQKPETGNRNARSMLAVLCFLLVSGFLFPISASAAQPITTDSRIKTFVYNANEVYNVTTHYGYQSNIEFGPKETIETVSIGDRIGWQVIPAGRRLFIRAMEENAHTNMTIVTNLRAYQFDLRSSSADAVFGSEELTYVVRFFYPEDIANGTPMPVSYVRDFAPPAPVQAPEYAASNNPSSSPTFTPAPTAHAAAPSATASASSGLNYRYTYSGPNDIAPVKIFDDGHTTYFKFAGSLTPQVSVITAKGESLAVPSRRTPDGMLAVDLIAPRFSLNQSGRQVVVYNEANGVM
jgi:type IV secretion system protein VirB9